MQLENKDNFELQKVFEGVRQTQDYVENTKHGRKTILHQQKRLCHSERLFTSSH